MPSVSQPTLSGLANLRVRKALGGNDKSASHATRVAGTENFKTKYYPDFPIVTIVETHPGRVKHGGGRFRRSQKSERFELFGRH